MPGWRVVPGALFGAFAILAIGAASRAPWSATPADRALVRLSWRAPSQVSEECRPLSEAEKAELPVHMRVPEVCERRAVPYSLRVAIDGAEILRETVHGAGGREDRPIYVFRELALAPGRYALEVQFVPISDESEPQDFGEGDEGGKISLEYAETIVLGEREVALITYDQARRALFRVVSP